MICNSEECESLCRIRWIIVLEDQQYLGEAKVLVRNEEIVSINYDHIKVLMYKQTVHDSDDISSDAFIVPLIKARLRSSLDPFHVATFKSQTLS